MEYTFFDHQGKPATCDLRVDRPNHLVLVSEIQNNPGMSVTNAVVSLANQVIRDFELDPNKLVWLERYDARIYREEADQNYTLVRFTYEDGWLTDPRWEYLRTQEAKTYLGLFEPS